MYINQFGNIIRNHGLDFHIYAGDTQIYISFKPGDSESRQTAISQVEACIGDFKTWMANKLLKLNDKAEVIIITTSETISRQEDIVINIGDSPIESTLTNPQLKEMINSALTSRVDYGNSLLYGIKGYLMFSLQSCQNNDARILSVQRKYITPVLKELHWLPVEQRMNYKMLLLAYKAQHGMATSFLSSLQSPYKPGRPLRSEGKQLTTPSISPRKFWQALLCACRDFHLEHAPCLHQMCAVHWHFQEQSDYTSVWCFIFIIQLDILSYCVYFVRCQLVSGVCLIP